MRYLMLKLIFVIVDFVNGAILWIKESRLFVFKPKQNEKKKEERKSILSISFCVRLKLNDKQRNKNFFFVIVLLF